MVLANNKSFPMTEFAAYQAEFKLDAHSLTGEPSVVRLPASPADFGDLRLTAESRCVDAGMDAGVNVDFAGEKRPQGAAPDIGAYESPGTR